MEIIYMKRYINSLYSFGTKKNSDKNGKNPLLFQFIKNVIKWTVIIIEEFHSCLLRIKFSQTTFIENDSICRRNYRRMSVWV